MAENNYNISTSCIYQGDFCEIKSLLAGYSGNAAAVSAYNDCFCFVLVRSGHFLFDLGSRRHEMHAGMLVVDKPDYEYVMHPTEGQCVIFNFTPTFYDAMPEEYNLRQVPFFNNKNRLARVLPSTAVIDYLHYQVLQGNGGRLKTDILVLELLRLIIDGMCGGPVNNRLPGGMKKNHLTLLLTSNLLQ